METLDGIHRPSVDCACTGSEGIFVEILSDPVSDSCEHLDLGDRSTLLLKVPSSKFTVLTTF